jgi:hypothetical protein
MVCNASSLPYGSSLQRCGAVCDEVRTVKRGAGRICGLPLNLQGRAAGCRGGGRSRGAAQCIGSQGSRRRPAAGPAGATAGVLPRRSVCPVILSCCTTHSKLVAISSWVTHHLVTASEALLALVQAEVVALEQQPRRGMQLAPPHAAAAVTPASEGGSCSTPADESHSRASAPRVPPLNVSTARQVVQQKPQPRASRCLVL